MPTDLQLMYANERMRGARHHAALREVAVRTGLDKDTVDRVLRRARRTDALEARKAKKS